MEGFKVWGTMDERLQTLSTSAGKLMAQFQDLSAARQDKLPQLAPGPGHLAVEKHPNASR